MVCSAAQSPETRKNTPPGSASGSRWRPRRASRFRPQTGRRRAVSGPEFHCGRPAVRPGKGRRDGGKRTGKARDREETCGEPEQCAPAALDLLLQFRVGPDPARRRAPRHVPRRTRAIERGCRRRGPPGGTSPGDRCVPVGLDIRIVMDNYATHKTAAVGAWLARRPHWHVHFTPTSASWINQVERWFAELTRKQLQRGVHNSGGRRIRRTTSGVGRRRRKHRRSFARPHPRSTGIASRHRLRS